MKRYKLLKDLPTFKAGTEGFYLDSSGNLMHESDCVGCTVYSASELISFPNILTDWFEEIPEQPKTVWDLQDRDRFWIVDAGDEEVYELTWDFMYESDRKHGDIFLTKKEAKQELARRTAKQILLRDTKGFKPNWRKCEFGWQVYYDSMRTKEKLVAEWVECTDGTIRFATEADAEASIKAHGKEWKIYLGVEE